MIPSFITIVIRNKRNDNKNELLLDNDMDQNIANVMEDVITNHVTLVVSEEEDDADNEYSEDDDDDDDNDDDDDYMMERTPTSTPEYDESSRMSRVDAVISFDGSNNNNCCVNMNTNTNTNTNNVDKIYYDSNSNSNRVRVVSYNDALFEDYDVMFPSDTSIMIVD